MKGIDIEIDINIENLEVEILEIVNINLMIVGVLKLHNRKIQDNQEKKKIIIMIKIIIIIN